MAYKPSQKTSPILEAARKHIESVSYAVTLRWCFYRLLQEGYYTCKKDYKTKWQPLSRKPRREGFQDWWHTETFVDDGRAIIHQAFGDATASQAIRTAKNRMYRFSFVRLDHFYHQDATIVWMFEAQGMAGQFKHHAPGIDLIPLGGDPSFPLKQQAADHLSLLIDRYKRPVTVLYAGDYDAGGLRIPMSTMRDVKAWSRYPDGDAISIKRVGINPEQAREYGVHIAPDGTIQWEALGDEEAGHLIKSAMGDFIDKDLITGINDASTAVTHRFRKKYGINNPRAETR